MNNEIILKSVYGKVDQIYFINPCPDPKTGRLPSHVKPVNANDEMILSEDEIDKQAQGLVHFVKASHVFEIVDGTKFDLDDVVDTAHWESIKNCNWIAKDRYEKNHNGDLVIDGNAKRYGVADLYVYRPDEITKHKISKKEIIYKASSYIYEDSDSERIKKARVLGRDLRRASKADVLDYLITKAEKDPRKIIQLYEGEDWKMQLFLLDAVDRGVIRKSEGLYKYDDKMLGGSLEATVTFLRDIRYRKILTSIKAETYPEMLRKSEIDELDNTVLTGTPHEANKKATKVAPKKK